MKMIEMDNISYKKLSEILTIKNGKDYKSHSKGNVPVYGSGGIISYIDTAVYDKPSVLIPRKGSLDKLYFVDTPFWNVDTIFYTEINTELVEPRYLYHYLKQAHLEKLNKAGGVPSLTQAVLNNLTIPLPPLPIQQEIVRILDTFTNLTAELTAELTARRKQYEYYRDELLTFGEDVSRVQLGLVCDFKYGKGNNIPNETGEYPVYGCNGIVSTTNTFNSEDAPIIGHIGSAGVVNWGKGKHFVTYNGTICRVKADKIRSRYAYYVLNSLHLERFVKGSQPFLSYGDFSKVLIPLPPIERQDEIVRILDQFDYFCNDLTSGIPAEISARQKQYEYYRDKLLTFKENIS